MTQDRLVRLGEIELFVRSVGSASGVPLLVIHGGPDWDHSYLLPGLELVAQHRRVVLFDIRGCGRSGHPLSTDGYQPELAAADVAGLVSAIGHEQVDLLGFSTGGQVAQLVAAGHPQLIRRLVLASTTAYPEHAAELDAWPEYRRRRALQRPPPADLDGAALTQAWARRDASICVWDQALVPAYLALLDAVIFTASWLGPWRQGALHPWRPPDPARVLRDLRRPVLVLHGAQDMAFPVSAARRLHQAVPGSRLVVLEEAGHMAHFERPGRWAAEVAKFLA